MITVITLLIILISSLGLIFSGSVVKNWRITVSQFNVVNDFFKRQLFGFCIAVIATIFAITIKGNQFLKIGEILNPPQPIEVLGIDSHATWLNTAFEISITLLIVTCLFLYFHLRKMRPLANLKKEYIYWAVLFALTNSLTEELIYRFVLINLLHDQLGIHLLTIISAFAFGIPHYKGMPNGILGILMASFLGFILARSVVETQGLMIAWGLHFILDVPIIITLFWTDSHQEQTT